MTNDTTISLDNSKFVFQAPGADANGRPPFRRSSAVEKVLSFFATLPVARPVRRHPRRWTFELAGSLCFGQSVSCAPVIPLAVDPFDNDQTKPVKDLESHRRYRLGFVIGGYTAAFTNSAKL